MPTGQNLFPVIGFFDTALHFTISDPALALFGL
jgi:hypothetical protein